jgi:outer membrane protein, adhesin transport system
VAEAIENEALKVADLYFEIFRARAQARLLADRTATLRDYRGKAMAREQQDGVIEATVLEGRIAGAVADEERMAARLRALEARFQQVTTLSPKFVSLASVAVPGVEGGFVDSSANPRVRAAQVAVDSSRENLAALNKDRYPKLFLQVQGGLGQDVLGIEGPDNDASAMAVVRWDLFDGGRKAAAVERGAAEVGKQQAIVNEVRLALDQEISAAMEDLRGASNRYDSLAEAIPSLARSVDQQVTAMEGGAASTRLLTLVAAVGELNSARRELVDAQVDRYAAAYRVLASAGVLVDYIRLKGGKGGK